MAELSGVEVLPVLHNAYSQQRVVEAARVVYGLGYHVFIVTKASGSAAQAGVPEAQKLALKMGRTFMCLPDLPDAIEVLKPNMVLLFVPKKYAQKPLSEVVNTAAGRLLAVFGGSDPGLSKKELEMGIAVYPDGIEEDVGSTGMVAIALYLLRSVSKLHHRMMSETLRRI
ncbi:MAG: RecB-family nuclease [Thermofilaceae archaeon]